MHGSRSSAEINGHEATRNMSRRFFVSGTCKLSMNGLPERWSMMRHTDVANVEKEEEERLT